MVHDIVHHADGNAFAIGSLTTRAKGAAPLGLKNQVSAAKKSDE